MPITERPTPGGMSIVSMDHETLRTLVARVLSEELGRPVVVEAIGWRDMVWDVVVRDAAR